MLLANDVLVYAGGRVYYPAHHLLPDQLPAGDVEWLFLRFVIHYTAC